MNFVIEHAKDNEVIAIEAERFFQKYPENPFLRGVAVVALSDSPEETNPDKISAIMMRVFIENGATAKDDQKYVLGLHMQNYGDLAIIDIISLDKGFHKEIAYEHMLRMGWPMTENGKPVDKFSETMQAPFIYVGGHAQIAGDEKVNFFASSGDYGNDVLFAVCNDIAAFTAQACGVSVLQEDVSKGEKFIENLLMFLKDNKNNDDFYERFIEYVYTQRSNDKPAFTGQQLSAIMSMKLGDMIYARGVDPITARVKELSGDGSLGQSILVNSVADAIRRKKQETES
jgi:hypothetical protein